MNIQASRRDMLKGGGALIVSFSFGGAIGDALAQGTSAKPLALTEVDSFLAIDRKGMVTVYTGKVDLGTGVSTALPQMVAEELDVPLRMIKLVQGDTALTPEQGTTWGSLTIQIGGMQLRNAAATAKAALLDEAAKRLGAKKEELKVTDGVVSAGNRRVSYGELIGDKSFSLKLDHTKPAAAKDPKDYKIVGKPVARLDVPDKVMGRFTYIQDLRLPGMLHGRVIRPPAIGAKLESVDESSIKDVAGVIKVVRQGDFLAVVAMSEWGAIKAAQKLEASWSKSETLPEAAKLWEHVRASKIAKDEVTSNVGNSAEAMGKEGVKPLKATYDFAIHTHGSIGPSCAVAEFKDGKLTSWSASQATHNLRKQLAKMFGMPVDNVRCIYLEGSGCYGRNGHEDAAADAALLAKAVERPVRVQWSRADEHGWDPKGPPTLIDLRGALDGGNVTAWESEFFIPQQTAGGFNVPLVAATLAGMPADDHIAPGNIFQNSGDPVQIRQCEDGLPPTGDDAVPSVLDPHAGADAEHLCQRVLHRRARCGGECRPGRVPLEVSRSRRQARHRGARPRCRRSRTGTSAPRPSAGQSGDIVTRPRLHLLQIRAGADLCRRRSRRSRSTGRPATSG